MYRYVRPEAAKAPVVRTRPGATQTPVLQTRPGGAQASKVQTGLDAAEAQCEAQTPTDQTLKNTLTMSANFS